MKKENTELKKMIGKLPKNWRAMSPENKIRVVLKKWRLIFCDKSYGVDPDYYDIRIAGYGYGDYKPFLDFKCLLSRNGIACFGLKNPDSNNKFDMSAFPEYIRAIIKKKAYTLDTGEPDYNMLSTSSDSGKTFAKAAKSMYFMLDLFEFGYTITDTETYEEEHPDIYPDAKQDDLWWK